MPLASLETSTSRQDRQPDLADQIAAALSRSAAVFQNLPSLVTLAALSSTAGLLVIASVAGGPVVITAGQVRQRPRAALAAQSALRLVLADLLWLAAH